MLFIRRFRRLGAIQDLEMAIALSEAGLERTPKDHPERARRLIYLGCHLRERYHQIGNLRDLATARIRLEAAGESVKVAPENYPERLNIFRRELYKRYIGFGDLQAAVTSQSHAAVDAIPEGYRIKS